MTTPSDRSPMAPGAMFRRRWTPVTYQDCRADHDEAWDRKWTHGDTRPDGWLVWQLARIVDDATAIRDTTERTSQ